MKNPYQVVKDFEYSVAEYVGSKYAVSVDSCTNAIFLCCKYVDVTSKTVTIPAKTYMSVPCSIIHAGGIVNFEHVDWKGAYQLKPFPIYDSALRLRQNMYISGSFCCLSFAGSKKPMKLGKGGMILTDDKKAVDWFKKSRYHGRNEMDHLVDNFSMLGWNMYMLPETAARGLLMMHTIEDDVQDVEVEYQDLSKFAVYKN